MLFFFQFSSIVVSNKQFDSCPICFCLASGFVKGAEINVAVDLDVVIES